MSTPLPLPYTPEELAKCHIGIQRLAEYLYSLDERKFYFAKVCMSEKEREHEKILVGTCFLDEPLMGKLDELDYHTCGTVGCAIGHCPNVFPLLTRHIPYDEENFKRIYPLRALDGGRDWDENEQERCDKGEMLVEYVGPLTRRPIIDYAKVAIALFMITYDEAIELFSPNMAGYLGKVVAADATPSEVANNISAFIRLKIDNPTEPYCEPSYDESDEE